MQTRAKTKTRPSVELDRAIDFTRRGSSVVVDKIKERPLMCAGIAAGAGFLIGGGLATTPALKLLRKSVSLVLQLTVLPVVVSRLQELIMDTVEERGPA